MKWKSISDSRSVENISDKRLRIEVQPAQANGLERTKRFVNVHLHFIVINLKGICKNFDVAPTGKTSADVHGCTDFDLIPKSSGVVLFGSILLSHSKTINAKVVGFLNLFTKRSNEKTLQL